MVSSTFSVPAEVVAILPVLLSSGCSFAHSTRRCCSGSSFMDGPGRA